MPPKNKKINKRNSRQKASYLKPETLVILKQVFLGIIIFSVIGLIITGIWHLSRIDSLTINEIEVADGPTIKGELLKGKINEVLEGEYLHLVPHRFSWFYPKEDIVTLLEDVPKIKTVNLKEVSSSRLAVDFEEYKPHALWCDESEENKECLFLDEEGFAFGAAPKLLGNSLVRYYWVGEKPLEKTYYSETEDFKKINKFTGLLNKIGWFVVRVEGDKAGDMFFILNKDSEIKISLREDVEKTFSYLESLRESKEFSHLQPGNFRYIDLRYGAKLYVNENLEKEGEGEEKNEEPVLETAG